MEKEKYFIMQVLVILLFSTLIFSANADSTSHIAYIAYSDNYWQLWTMDENGKNQKQITTVKYDLSRISWFPDREHVLLNGTQGQLAKVSIKTGEVIPIKLPLNGSTDAVVSPNGKQIAFSVSTAEGIDTNNIWVVDVNGENLHRITTMAYLQHDPVWSSNGNEIYFLAGDGKQSHNIFKVNLENKELEQLTAGNLYHFDLAINKDNGIAFSSNRFGNYEIFVMKKGNQIAKQLTFNPALDGRPAWSSDSKKIIFESTRSGVPNLWIFDIHNKTVRQLTTHKRGARAPVWFQSFAGMKQ